MAKRKGSKRKKGPTGPSLSSDQRKQLEQLLSKPERLDISDVGNSLPDSTLAAAFLERLPSGDPGLVPILVAVRDHFPEKPVQKAARKAAFRFEQQGIPVPSSARDEHSVLRRTTPDQREPFAFLTPLDGDGVRGVLLGVPRPPQGIELGAALAGDEDGILQYAGGTFSNKKARAARDDFMAEFQHVVPASAEHAVSVLERSHRVKPNAPGGAAYLRARPWLLDRISPAETPPARELFPEEGQNTRPFTESMAARLLSHEILASWMVDPRRAQSLAEDIEEAEASPIHLSEDQVDRRIYEIKRAWIEDYFSEPVRERVQHRLEETAYILYHLKDPELARLALVACRSLQALESLFDIHPLLRMMTEKTLTLLQGDPEDPSLPGESGQGTDSGPEETTAPSGIIIP